MYHTSKGRRALVGGMHDEWMLMPMVDETRSVLVCKTCLVTPTPGMVIKHMYKPSAQLQPWCTRFDPGRFRCGA